MAKVLILVEGQTEYNFVTRILSPHFLTYSVYPIARIITTRHNIAGKDEKGGTVAYPEAKKQIQRLLGDSSARMITTMLDYYGLHESFPRRKEPVIQTCYEKVISVEQAIAKDINSNRFLPYLQLHEFEGLLFCSPEAMADELAEPGTEENRSYRAQFDQIKSGFSSPEEINDSRQTNPSHRIKELAGHYDKVHDGEKIINRIGIEPIRSQCPHFRQWLERLENLGP